MNVVPIEMEDCQRNYLRRAFVDYIEIHRSNNKAMRIKALDLGIKKRRNRIINRLIKIDRLYDEIEMVLFKH